MVKKKDLHPWHERNGKKQVVTTKSNCVIMYAHLMTLSMQKHSLKYRNCWDPMNPVYGAEVTISSNPYIRSNVVNRLFFACTLLVFVNVVLWTWTLRLKKGQKKTKRFTTFEQMHIFACTRTLWETFTLEMMEEAGEVGFLRCTVPLFVCGSQMLGQVETHFCHHLRTCGV